MTRRLVLLQPTGGMLIADQIINDARIVMGATVKNFGDIEA